MKDITQEVTNGTYPKPLGRGVLDWRSMDLLPVETKHIIEHGGWFFYIKRNTIKEVALLASIDRGKEMPVLTGLAELLDVERVFAHSKITNDEELVKLGFHLCAARYRLPYNPDDKKPVNMTEDCLLTDEERDSYIKEAEGVPSLQNAMERYGLGTAKFHRVDYGGGRAALILVGEEPNGLDLLSHFSLDVEGEMFCGDMYAYVCSQHKLGGEYTVGVQRFQEAPPIIITLETHAAKAAGIYVIEKGESNAG